MTTLDVFVPGLPRPQGSMRPIPVGQHVRLVDGGGTNLAIWRAAVSDSALRHWGIGTPSIDGPVTMLIDFYLPRPASAPKRRVHPDRKPDIDKLVRAVLDALTGIVFTDDARVVSLQTTKRYAVDCPLGARIMAAPVIDASVPGPEREGESVAPREPSARLGVDNPARDGAGNVLGPER